MERYLTRPEEGNFWVIYSHETDVHIRSEAIPYGKQNKVNVFLTINKARKVKIVIEFLKFYFIQ